MLAFFIKIVISHGFVTFLKAAKSLKRFSQFDAIYSSLAVWSIQSLSFAILFYYKVDRGLNNNGR